MKQAIKYQNIKNKKKCSVYSFSLGEISGWKGGGGLLGTEGTTVLVVQISAAAHLISQLSLWDCIRFHLTTLERCGEWSPTGDGGTVPSEPENRRKTRLSQHADQERVASLKTPNHHLKTAYLHEVWPPPPHTYIHACKHEAPPHFLISQTLIVPLLTSSGFPAPTTINFPSSSPTRMWLHSFVTDTLLTDTFKARGATSASRLSEKETLERKNSSFRPKGLFCKLQFLHLYRSRMCRLPCMVPRMMYSDTRWRAVTCSAVVKDDSRQPFTE